MKIIVNGECYETAVEFLADLLTELDYESEWLVAARNSEVVPRHDHADCRLAEGDRIEILTPKAGG